MTPILQALVARCPICHLSSQTRLEALAYLLEKYGLSFASLPDMSQCLSLIGFFGRRNLRTLVIEDAFFFGPRPAEVTVPLVEIVGCCEGLRELEVRVSDGELIRQTRKLHCEGGLVPMEDLSSIPTLEALTRLRGVEVKLVFMDREDSDLRWNKWLDGISERVRKAALRPRTEDSGRGDV